MVLEQTAVYMHSTQSCQAGFGSKGSAGCRPIFRAHQAVPDPSITQNIPEQDSEPKDAPKGTETVYRYAVIVYL